ncbi:cobalamin biosynthesis protein CbiX [Streptomyces sp. NPDC052077]|uniref:sirohydrochlorin chelatase n=1 Tax=Streptomyces sp. NPDC052077 TaxID=3154757 RepID=UPI003425F393
MRRGTVVAVGGHESDGGRALRGLLDPGVARVGRGRELLARVRAERARDEPVCVVPMTLGRDPDLIADAARTLLALSPAERAGTVLAGPFGTADHLTGWLRSAALRVPADRALLVTAPTGDPFSDADLFRIARLVRQYGRHRLVETALIGGDPDPAEGVRRCRALGAERVTPLAASWVLPVLPAGASDPVRPLLTAPAVAGVLAARAADAWHLHDRHGDDGLSRALTAAHGHGHAHSHGPGDDGHDHGTPGHGHGHGTPSHGHGPGGHDHGHGTPGHGHAPGAHGHDHGEHPHPHGPGEPGPAHGGHGDRLHGTPAPGAHPDPRDGRAPAPYALPFGRSLS